MPRCTVWGCRLPNPCAVPFVPTNPTSPVSRFYEMAYEEQATFVSWALARRWHTPNGEADHVFLHQTMEGFAMSMLAITSACSLCCLGLLPSETTVSDKVDLVEVNHYFDETASHVFDQVIFYDWSPEAARFQVRAWRLVKDAAQLPARNWASGGYDVTWNDGQFIRCVHAAAMRESWTQHDPEMRERGRYPKEYRRELLVPRAAPMPDAP